MQLIETRTNDGESPRNHAHSNTTPTRPPLRLIAFRLVAYSSAASSGADGALGAAAVQNFKESEMKRLSRVAILASATALLLGLAIAPTAGADVGFSIYGSYWEPDETSDAGGGGLEIAFPLNEHFDIDFRASYFEELDPEPLQELFDSDSPFRTRGVEVLPLELGVRFNFAPDAGVRPYIGAGGGYYVIDSDFGEIGDEGGWYGLFGLGFGDRDGASFFVEAQYRKMEATVEEDPDDPFDFEGFDPPVVLDLDGLGANAGVTWRF